MVSQLAAGFFASVTLPPELASAWRCLESTADLAGYYSSPDDVRAHLTSLWLAQNAVNIDLDVLLPLAVSTWEEARSLSKIVDEAHARELEKFILTAPRKRRVAAMEEASLQLSCAADDCSRPAKQLRAARVQSTGDPSSRALLALEGPSSSTSTAQDFTKSKEYQFIAEVFTAMGSIGLKWEDVCY